MISDPECWLDTRSLLDQRSSPLEVTLARIASHVVLKCEVGLRPGQSIHLVPLGRQLATTVTSRRLTHRSVPWSRQLCTNLSADSYGAAQLGVHRPQHQLHTSLSRRYT